LAIRRRRQVQKALPKNTTRINEHIKVPEIRLVGDNIDEINEVLGLSIEAGAVVKTHHALNWARDVGLDLIEISPKAIPPVCKIEDFKKFLYLLKKKQKAIKSNTSKTVFKEVRFGPNTDDHDFNFKLKHAHKFLEDGAKVKAYIHFRGRSIIYKERGELLLLKLIKELDDIGSVESLPKMEGKRRMTVIITPKKGLKKS